MNLLRHFIKKDKYSKNVTRTALTPLSTLAPTIQQPKPVPQQNYNIPKPPASSISITKIYTAQPTITQPTHNNSIKPLFKYSGDTQQAKNPFKQTFMPTPEQAQQRKEQFFGWMKPSGSTYNNTRYDSSKTMAVEIGTGRIASQNPGMNTGNTKLEDHYFIQNKGGAWKDMGIYNDSLRR